MTLDFQQVQQKVRELGDGAAERAREMDVLTQRACDLLENSPAEQQHWREKVQHVAETIDHGLRCALPLDETINRAFPCPPLPESVTVVAADGSQIVPDRHAEVEYGLINVGSISMRYGCPEPPLTQMSCDLFYGDALYTPTGILTEDMLNLKRDLAERAVLADLAKVIEGKIITFTDGPIEIWGAKDGDQSNTFQDSLKIYLAALEKLHDLGASIAGYVDKPGANLVVRLLEIAMTPEDTLPNIKNLHPLRGVRDADLYRDILKPGDRTAVFAMQSQSSKSYRGPLGLHFFYLNVGSLQRPWLARVEVPAWVVSDQALLDDLHAVLVHQCEIMGANPYPYLLHRAHETARVSYEDKGQVTNMIVIELQKRGVKVGEVSRKQQAKGLKGRTRFGA